MSNSGNRAGLLEMFRRHRFTKDISFGVVDVHTHLLEDDDAVRRSLEEALTVLPKDQIWVDPDCGLKTRAWEETLASLRNMVQAARELRPAPATVTGMRDA